MATQQARLSWYRSSIDKAVLSKLTQRSNWRPLLHNVSMLGFSAATGTFAYWAFHNLAWPWFVAALFFHCTFYGFFGGGAGGHELSHKNMFKSKRLNEVFMRINSFLTWFNFVLFRHSHTNHHHYTVHRDLDFEVMLPMNLRWYQWIFGLVVNPVVVFKSIAAHAQNAMGRIPKSYTNYFDRDDEREMKKMTRWARVLVIGHSTLAALFIASGNWIFLLIVTFAPFMCNWFVLLTHKPQHMAMRANVADWRVTTRTYLAGPIVRYFYWNMNYHIEHHMFAAVPYYNLPELRKAIEFDLPAAPKGLIRTWKEIASAVKRRKREPGYHVSPDFPETAIPPNIAESATAGGAANESRTESAHETT